MFQKIKDKLFAPKEEVTTGTITCSGLGINSDFIFTPSSNYTITTSGFNIGVRSGMLGFPSPIYPTMFPEQELLEISEDIGLDETIVILIEKYGEKHVLDSIPRSSILKYLKDEVE